VRGGHNDAGADAKICAKISSDFMCIYEKIAGGQGYAPRSHSNCCLSLYLNIAGVRQGPGKMLLGSGKTWKSPENFCNRESGNPVSGPG